MIIFVHHYINERISHALDFWRDGRERRRERWWKIIMGLKNEYFSFQNVWTYILIYAHTHTGKPIHKIIHIYHMHIALFDTLLMIFTVWGWEGKKYDSQWMLLFSLLNSSSQCTVLPYPAHVLNSILWNPQFIEKFF